MSSNNGFKAYIDINNDGPQRRVDYYSMGKEEGGFSATIPNGTFLRAGRDFLACYSTDTGRWHKVGPYGMIIEPLTPKQIRDDLSPMIIRYEKDCFSIGAEDIKAQRIVPLGRDFLAYIPSDNLFHNYSIIDLMGNTIDSNITELYLKSMKVHKNGSVRIAYKKFDEAKGEISHRVNLHLVQQSDYRNRALRQSSFTKSMA